MTSKGTRPDPLDAQAVRTVVLEALSNEGSYKESIHARFEHLERHISIQDVIFGLKQPWLACAPDEFNEDEWQWKYKIRTVDIEGDSLTVIVALDPRNQRFEIVTRF